MSVRNEQNDQVFALSSIDISTTVRRNPWSPIIFNNDGLIQVFGQVWRTTIRSSDVLPKGSLNPTVGSLVKHGGEPFPVFEVTSGVLLNDEEQAELQAFIQKVEARIAKELWG